MKSPYVVALIEKDPVEKIAVVVPTHEVPVLNIVHKGAVTVLETADLPQGLTETEEFEAEDEFARLEARYGNSKETNLPFVVMAYGTPSGMEAEIGKSLAPSKRKGKAADA